MILDVVSGPSLYNPVTYSDFIQESDNINLLILSNGVSQRDKDLAFIYKEINDPTTNGLMESVALEWNNKYRIDVICNTFTIINRYKARRFNSKSCVFKRKNWIIYRIKFKSCIGIQR